MKILYFTNIIAPYRVGLFNKLNKYFYSNIKFYFDRKTELNREWKIDVNSLKFNYEIRNTFFYNKVSNASNNSNLQRFIYFPFHIFPVILKEKPSVILSTEFGLRTLFALIGGKLTGAKVYVLSEVTAQSEKYISNLKLSFRKMLSRLLDGGIAYGKQSFDYLVKLGFDKTKIIISPDAIDNEYFFNLSKNINKSEARNKLGWSGRDFIFLYVGRFIQIKGLDLLIRTINRFVDTVNNKRIRFVFVGGSESELKKLSNNTLSGKIKVYNFTETEQLIYFYKASDCFIFPTRNDVWGLVVNEAVATGLPVAVSRYAGSANDLIEDKISGLVFDPLNEKAFIDTLKFCAENPDKLYKYAEKAKERLVFFNHDIAAKRIVDFVYSS